MRPIHPCDAFVIRRAAAAPVQPPERTVRARRLQLGLTLAELGRLAGVSRETAGRLDRGLSVRPETRAAVERALSERERPGPGQGG